MTDADAAGGSVRAVIFDLDGVIVESEQVWERVRSRFVESHGGVWRGESQRHMMGISTRDWARYLKLDLGVQLELDEIPTRVISAMQVEYERHLPLVAGAVPAVRGLAREWSLAVASGSPRVLIETVLRTAEIIDDFKVLVSSDEVNAGKPAPDVYLEAARRLGVPIGSCVVVEDSSNGILSGHAAGAKIIAIPNAAFPPDAGTLRLANKSLRAIHQLTPSVIRAL